MRYATLLLLLGCSSAPAAGGEGFVPLFNGRDLTGWVRVNCAPETFRAEDGMIITTGKPTGVLRSERMYENYIAEFDWMHLKQRGNSGFFVHSGAFPAMGTPFTKGHEIQVLDGDSTDGTWTGHGDVFSIHGATFEPDRPHPKGWMRCLPSEKRANPFGQWNHYRVTVNHGSIKLEVNGKEVSGGSRCNPRKGYICLESEGSECHFKNLLIKELPSTNPPESEIAEADQGFTSLYSGLDFRGWKTETGTFDHWTSRDWRFEGSGKGESERDALYTEKEYQDFRLSFDWQSPKGGQPVLRLRHKMAIKFSAEEKPGIWHRYEIIVQKGRYSLVKDGKETPSEEKSVLRMKSPVGLEASGQPVIFANVFIKEP
ncbi:MAG: DUF1080 domain-containing protein [Planctomycetes bacterium]|nr:DUF1080 domain-containing protein [Planctomycetota bacterium]